MSEWKVIYELGGQRGALYVYTLTADGALLLFGSHFPMARIIRVAEVLS